MQVSATISCGNWRLQHGQKAFAATMLWLDGQPWVPDLVHPPGLLGYIGTKESCRQGNGPQQGALRLSDRFAGDAGLAFRHLAAFSRDETAEAFDPEDTCSSALRQAPLIAL